jgi:adenylate kinase
VVVFFGPAGAGKSVQGQMLAARHGWRWLSTGKLLRESQDEEILKGLQGGHLADSQTVYRLFDIALEDAQDFKNIILDGFPRTMEQAKWLVENKEEYVRSIDVVIVLEVPRDELVRRMMKRGRADDTQEAIERRLMIYRKEMYPILSYLTENDVHVAHIDGTGTVGQVHDRIEEELASCSLV